MKWLSTKTHRPPSNDVVIARIFRDGYVRYLAAYLDDDIWVFPDASNKLQGIWEVTHFIIPDALVLEDTEKPKSDKDTPCVGGWI